MLCGFEHNLYWQQWKTQIQSCFFTLCTLSSVDHRIVKVGKDLQDHWVQSSTKHHHVNWTTALTARSSRYLNTSRHRYSSTSLGSPFQCLTILSILPDVNLNLPWPSLICSWDKHTAESVVATLLSADTQLGAEKLACLQGSAVPLINIKQLFMRAYTCNLLLCPGLLGSLLALHWKFPLQGNFSIQYAVHREPLWKKHGKRKVPSCKHVRKHHTHCWSFPFLSKHWQCSKA